MARQSPPNGRSTPERSTPERSLGTLFFRNGHLLTLTILVVLVAGASAFSSLPRLEDPRITNRNPLIVTPVPGASAERVESQVTERLEEALDEIDEISKIESVSRAGVSVLNLELDANVGLDTNEEIYSEIRAKLVDAAPNLPPEAQTPVFDDKRGATTFTMIVAIRWRGQGDAPLGILDRTAEELADRLRSLDGTELVRRYGAPDEEITVTVDAAQLADLGLAAGDVARGLARADAKGAAGTLRGQRSDVQLEVEGELGSLERIAAVPLSGAAGDLVRVGDVAQVRREPRTPPREIALVDGDRAVLVGARVRTDVRVDRWAPRAIETVDAFAAHAGHGGVAVERIFEQEPYTSRQLTDLGQTLLAGAVVVMAVVLLMMGWRLALIVGLALPLVVSTVLFGWQLSGGAIHQMSIFGMIIALGLLIDNAIVVADEVSRGKGAGRSPVAAVDAAVRHLFWPLLASTLTTVLAFAPILLLPGNVGDFVGSIGSSVILAIVTSFVFALTITAALAGRFGSPPPGTSDGKDHPDDEDPSSEDDGRRWWRHGIASGRFLGIYRRALTAGLNRPVAALLVALFLPFSGFLAARSLGNEFFPPVDRDMFHVQLWLPPDAAIGHTLETAEAVEAVIREQPGTEHVHWLVGGNFPSVYYNLVMFRDGSPHFAQAVVTARTSAEAKEMIDPLQTELDARFPGAQMVVRQFGQGPPVYADVEYRILGPDLAVMQDLGERIRLALQAHPDVLHTQMTMPRGQPKLWLQADEDEARLAGLALGDLAGQLQANLEGGVAGTVVEGLEQMPVRVRYSDDRRGDLAAIASAPLARGPGGDWMSLQAVGHLELRPELGGIGRYNSQRTNVVRAFTRNDALPIDVTRGVLAQLEAEGFELPPGYRLDLGGAAEEDAEAKAQLSAYVPVLLTLSVATLILAFGSVRLAALLGAVALLSVGLALLATWSIGFPVSFNTILGTLGLIGVALNDSIVVLAAIRANPDARAGDIDAVVKEVVAVTRHVLSTTLTTIGGFLPLLLWVGGDFWPPLAIVLAGGITGASILALVLIPAAYVLLMRPRRRPAPVRTAVAVSLLSILAGGCTVGPDHEPPAVGPEALGLGEDRPAPSSAVAAVTAKGPSEAVNPPPDAAWWKALGDDMMEELVNDAVAHNHDLEAARARVRQARALRRAVAAGGRPQLAAQVSGAGFRLSENGPEAGPLALGLAEVEGELYQVGFDAGWEIDVFGGVRRRVEAADARLGAAVESRRGLLLTIIAEVARNYTELRGAQRRLALAEKNVELQVGTHRLVENKAKAGLVSKLDIHRAAALLEGTRALVPPLRADVRAAAHRLAVLTGRPPAALSDRLTTSRPLADPPDLVPVGLDSHLLRRRPDVRAAERRLAAASADIGAATALRYPRFFLTGRGGTEGGSFTDLFDASSRVWSLGPSISWPWFQGGRLRAGVDAAEDAHRAAEAEYRGAVLGAAEDVESALVRYAEEQLRRRALANAADAARRSVDLAQVLYDKGLSDFLPVLDAERTQTEVEDQLAISETAVVLRLVALYKALGGGWQVAEAGTESKHDGGGAAESP
ncbi:MAG: efflux RND transporter permease subunit [Acidobacteriota bacterium]